jgi:hypothetical protein
VTGLAALKADLLAQWDHARRPDDAAEAGIAMLQSLRPASPPRGGLAIGEGIDPITGQRRIEMRLHAGGRRSRAKAEQLVAYSQLQGIDAIFRIFGARPALPVPQAKPPAAALLGGSRRPLHIGASVAHEHGSAGTLGAFVRLEDGGIGMLSCSHVLARAFRKRVRAGDDIQQPGSPDNILPGNRIATLTSHFSLFQPSKADNLDAAVAALNPQVSANALGNVLPDVECVPQALRGRELGAPLLQEEIEPGMNVCKIGRTTGYTRGVVSLVEVDNFKPDLGSREAYTFGSVIEVSWRPGEAPFTERGDSGSLVFEEETLRPIGIHFCSVPLEPEGWTSYLVPWWRIERDFPISFA